MDEYACLTLLSKPDETAEAFKSRLIAFWSQMLRKWPDEYERVYAESTETETRQSRLTRRYMVGVDIAELLERELAAAGIEHDPIDTDDLYSKFEATPPEWFQVPH